MEKKQTAVEFLIEKIDFDANVRCFSKDEWKEIFEQAKQMEKEEILDAFKIGSDKGYDCAFGYITHEECDEHNYYNETYGETKN